MVTVNQTVGCEPLTQHLLVHARVKNKKKERKRREREFEFKIVLSYVMNQGIAT